MSFIPVLDLSATNFILQTAPLATKINDVHLPAWPEHCARQALDMYGFSPSSENAVLQLTDEYTKTMIFLNVNKKITTVIFSIDETRFPSSEEVLQLRAYSVFLKKLYESCNVKKSHAEFEEVLLECNELLTSLIEKYFTRNSYGMRAFLYDYACEVMPTLTATYQRPVVV